MLLVPMSLGYYHKKEEGKKKRKLGRSFQHVVGGGGGWRAAAPDLEKVIVIHDPVRYPVAGAWTVAIVPFRFVTPRPRACAKVQKRLRGSELHNIPRIQAHTHKAGLHHLFFFSYFRPQTSSLAGHAQTNKGADLGAHGPLPPWIAVPLKKKTWIAVAPRQPCTCPVCAAPALVLLAYSV